MHFPTLLSKHPEDNKSHLCTSVKLGIASFHRQILILIRLAAYPNCYFIIKFPEKEAIAVVLQKGRSVKWQLLLDRAVAG